MHCVSQNTDVLKVGFQSPLIWRVVVIVEDKLEKLEKIWEWLLLLRSDDSELGKNSVKKSGLAYVAL